MHHLFKLIFNRKKTKFLQKFWSLSNHKEDLKCLKEIVFLSISLFQRKKQTKNHHKNLLKFQKIAIHKLFRYDGELFL